MPTAKLTSIVLLLPLFTLAADWKPAAGPLMTRWAKDVDPKNPLPEYPRPQLVREKWTNLNGLWDYAITAKDAAKPDKWDGQILVPYPVESALSGIMKPLDKDQRLWYRRSFDKPAAAGRTLLHFGAVDWQSTIYVNGTKLGEHTGGFDPFHFDITDALKDGTNELVVSVLDPSNSGYQPRGKQHFPAIAKPGGIMYTPCSGIWQTVWMESVQWPYVRSIKITPDFDNSSVKVDLDVATNPRADQQYPISVAAFDGATQVAVSNAGATSHVLKIANAKPWSDQSPFLYDLKVTVGNDTASSYFGMRKIEVKKDDKGINRIFLNNQPIFMAGPLDQGFWPDGIYTAPTDAALKYDIEITKKLGFNATRKHVKVEPARWYYWCDKLGLIVWQDMPSGDNGVTRAKRGEKATDASDKPEAIANYQRELKAMIDSLHNHPSIVMWVVFNEGWGQFDTVKNTGWVKQYDPTRLANPASGWNDYPAGDVIDMHNYPGPGAPKPQETRAGVLGEFGGLGLPTEKHMWTDKNWGYRGVADNAALTRQYCKLLSRAYGLKDSAGLCAAIYTQLTDVETEANGLLTYDRAVIKVDLDQVAQANQGKFPPAPERIVILPTSKDQPQSWSYTTDKPADNWSAPDFNASSWKQAPGGFGTKNTPGSVIGTEWKSEDIWIRRTFTLSDKPLKDPMLILHHDEDAEIHINGVLAAKTQAFISDYEEFEISKEAKATLKPGQNTIAIHCKQTRGGQYIDAGLTDAK